MRAPTTVSASAALCERRLRRRTKNGQSNKPSERASDLFVSKQQRRSCKHHKRVYFISIHMQERWQRERGTSPFEGDAVREIIFDQRQTESDRALWLLFLRLTCAPYKSGGEEKRKACMTLSRVTSNRAMQILILVNNVTCAF